MEKVSGSYLPLKALFCVFLALGSILFYGAQAAAKGRAADLCLQSFASEPEVEILYLHGWLKDSPFYLNSHTKSLANLKQIAETCRARIFIPESNFNCLRSPGTVRCWNRSKENEMGLVWDDILERVPNCLKAERSQDVVIIGFSDGAYFLNRVNDIPVEWKAILISGLEPAAKLPAVKVRQNPGHWLSAQMTIRQLQKIGYCK